MCTEHQDVIGVDQDQPDLAGSLLGRRRFLGGVAVTALSAAGLTELALPAQAAVVSQNGWGVITTSSSTALDRGFTAGGEGFPGGVRRGDVSTILRYVASRLDAEVEALHNPGCWGWSYRLIRGGTSYSNHASATAIDCNAPRHPLGSAGTFSAAQVRTIHAILGVCEGTVRWGGDYSGRKDEMHFEINRGPGDPAIARVAKKLGGGGGNPPPAASGWPTLQVGSKGFQVRSLQFLLVQAGFALTADGVFGANTKAAVVAFQARKGLARDGVVGPKTWAAAVVTVRSGSRGAAVKGVQSALNAHGSSLTVDGIAGSGTVAAIVAFQRRSGLSADGIAGAKTWNALV
jgi:hypothetical protein